MSSVWSKEKPEVSSYLHILAIVILINLSHRSVSSKIIVTFSYSVDHQFYPAWHISTSSLWPVVHDNHQDFITRIFNHYPRVYRVELWRDLIYFVDWIVLYIWHSLVNYSLYHLICVAVSVKDSLVINIKTLPVHCNILAPVPYNKLV